MRVLLVKLSSLGDVIHTLPVVQDLHRAFPGIEIDWVVEPSFAGVLEMHPGLSRIIPCSLRRWRRERFNAQARREMREFWAQLTQERYDGVFDLQGLSKSAVVAKLAKLTKGGARYAMANRTLGSSYEPVTRWLCDRSIELPLEVHALERARLMCAKALGYSFSPDVDFGLVVPSGGEELTQKYLVPAQSETQSETHNKAHKEPEQVAFLMGTSRADKCWPLEHWVSLGQRLNSRGVEICLVHGSEAELETCQAVAQQLGSVQIWPRCTLVELAQRLQTTVGSVGVDSGPSHLSVALQMVHVQIYRFDTAWRTGPMATWGRAYQQSVLQLHGPNEWVHTTESGGQETSSQVDPVGEVLHVWDHCCAAKASTLNQPREMVQ